MARIAGTVFFRVDDQQFSIAGEWKVSSQTVVREPIVGLDGQVHYKETPVAPYFEGDVLAANGVNALLLQKIVDSSATCELANGETWTLGGATWVGESPTDALEGKVPLKLVGQTCDLQ